MRKGKSLTVRCRESDGNEISHRGRERDLTTTIAEILTNHKATYT